MQRRLQLIPQASHIDGGILTRSCLVRRTDGSCDTRDEVLWFRLPSDIPAPRDDDCEAYLLAVIMTAMKEGRDVVIDGEVSKELLSNLTEFQMAWSRWLPDTYYVVEIIPEATQRHRFRKQGAVAAFSGGLDAQFTAYRHANGLAGFSNKEIKAAVFVQGFDIRLSDKEGFKKAALRARETVERLGLNLLEMSTNVREIASVNWEHLFGSAVAASLTNLKAYVGAGLIGSSEPYDALILPWGSNPISDPLLSSSDFQIIHDGAGFSRSEKLRTIASWPPGVKNLRVCWSGELAHRNCGTCEKCIRTRVGFLIAGVRNPSCFQGLLEPSHLDAVTLHGEGSEAEWRLLRDEARKAGLGALWVGKIDEVLNRKPASSLEWLLPSGSRRRALASRVRRSFERAR